LSHTASVEASSNAPKPPSAPPLSCTPVVCEYLPDSRLDRLGAQSAVVTKLFSKLTPLFTISFSTVGMTGVTQPSFECSNPIVSKRWSSLRMKTMFGRSGAAIAASEHAEERFP
jgi:hypothetical protein